MKYPSTAVLVLLCLFIPVVRLQEDLTPTDDGHTTDTGTDGTAAELDEIKDLLTTIKSKINIHLKQFRAFRKQAQKVMNSMKSDISSLTDDVASLNELINKSVASVNCYSTTEERPDQQYCARYRCGGTGGWRRVVYLDMTDPTTTCPSGWQLTTHSKRTCGRATAGSLTCDSAIFPVCGGPYTRVCGRIKAYQYGQTDAFEAYHLDQDGLNTIDSAYVSGVSLTHGSPRQHIWTFAAGAHEAQPIWKDTCPCDATISIRIPDFVGTDYFCESGVNSGIVATYHFYPDDPLWDGQDCHTSSTCCSFNTPPYFTKLLPNPTTDDIEARICQKDNNDDSPVEFVELYVQ